MESQEIYYKEFYGDLKLTVYAPQKYIDTETAHETNTKDKYSCKLYFSKMEEDKSTFFAPYAIQLFEDVKEKLPFPNFIVTLPSHEEGSECSVTVSKVAQTLAGHLKIEYVNGLHRLKTIHRNSSLSSKQERFENVNGSLSIKKEHINKLKNSTNVVVLDDIKTTGISLMESAVVLKGIGIKSITCFTLGINT